MDVQKEEKRSSFSNYTKSISFSSGVGVRQERMHNAVKGGGYLNNCNDSELSLLDLQKMGIPYVWQQVAKSIGVLAFLEMWQTLDSMADTGVEHNGSLRVSIPNFDKVKRWQRNNRIAELLQQGLSPKCVQKLLKSDGIEISIRSIYRLQATVCH